MRRWLQARRHGERGAVIPLVALGLTVLMTMTAFAVDLGRMRTERRDLQAGADAIALDSAQRIRGLAAPAAHTAAWSEAQQSAARNDVALTQIQSFRVGHWDVATQAFTPLTGAADLPNAVEVVLTDSVKMAFDFSADRRSVTRRSVAVATGQAQAELGSVFAGLQTYDPANLSQCNAALDAQMSFMNRIFTPLLKISVSGGVKVDSGPVDCGVTGAQDGLDLDLASWRGLASSRVALGPLASALGFASAQELLSQQVSVRRLLEASATSLSGGSGATDLAAQTSLTRISAAVAQDARISMGSIFTASTGPSGAGAAEASVNALQLLSASAMAMDGSNFVRFDAPVNVPGATTQIRPTLTVVEPPKLDTFKSAFQAGPETAQVRFALDVPLSGLNLDPALLGGTLALEPAKSGTGRIGLVVEVAKARSTYGAISCATPKDGTTVDFTVDTGAVTASLGAVSTQILSGPVAAGVKLERTPLVNGSFSAVVGVGLVTLDLTNDSNVTTDLNIAGRRETKSFTGPFATPVQRYQGGLGGTRLTDEVLSRTTLASQASVLAALLTTEAREKDLVAKALSTSLNPLQTEVIDPMLAALGLTLGGADARIHDVRCSTPALANRD